jgi:hypothetical protein
MNFYLRRLIMTFHRRTSNEQAVRYEENPDVIKARKKRARHFKSKQQKELERRADQILYDENHGITDYWLE